MSDLRKSITRKERELDHKITQYATFADNVQFSTINDDDVDTTDHMKSEIRNLLETLSDLNRQLMSAGVVSNTITQQHMGRLQTFTSDFKRVQRRIEEMRNKADLLRHSKTQRSNDKWNDEMVQLMNEQDASNAAHRAADRVLNQATSTHRDLESQRERLDNLTSRAVAMGRRVPGLNALLSRIQTRRDRDRLLMAACIGVGCTFLLLYWYYN